MKQEKNLFGGVDAGSRAVKFVVFDADNGRIAAAAAADQGLHQDRIVDRLMDSTMAGLGLKPSDIRRIVATGYGRHNVKPADAFITEITCHARGAAFHRPDARTVIDIGGQDSKFIRMDGKGRVHDFIMNDRCAAGTGRFLEIVAKRLEIDISSPGIDMAQAVPSVISSMCVVFAETEIIGLLAAGAKPANIFAGVQNAVAARILAMSGSRASEPVVFTGGVASIPGMHEAIEKAMDRKITRISEPNMAGALGAALIAAD